MAHIIDNSNGPGNLPDKTDQIVKATNELGTTSKKYSVEDIDAILKTCAFQTGNYSRTAQLVREEFCLEVHPNTVRKMVIEQYPDRYAQIQREIAEDVSDRVSGRLGDVLVKGANVQDTLLDQLAERLESKPDIDVNSIYT
jgi:hypothetical protein